MMKVSMSTHCFEKVPNLPERLLKRVRKYRLEWPGRTYPIRELVPPFLGALTSLLPSCYYSHWDRALESSVGHQHLWQMASSLHRNWILFIFIFQVHGTNPNMVSIQWALMKKTMNTGQNYHRVGSPESRLWDGDWQTEGLLECPRDPHQ